LRGSGSRGAQRLKREFERKREQIRCDGGAEERSSKFVVNGCSLIAAVEVEDE